MAWLRSLGSFLNSERTLSSANELEGIQRSGSKDAADHAQEGVQAMMKLVLRLVLATVQVGFLLVISLFLIFMLFMLWLMVEWLIVAAIVKPQEVLPLGMSVVTVYASATTVARQMKSKAKKLKKALRSATEMHMKRQYLVYIRKKEAQKSLAPKKRPVVSQASEQFLQNFDVDEELLTNEDVQAVDPAEIFAYFADSEEDQSESESASGLSKAEFDSLFENLGWIATAVERDHMFAYCDADPSDLHITASEWMEGWDALLDFQVEKVTKRLGLTDGNVVFVVTLVVVANCSLILFVLMAASAFQQGSNFISVVQSGAIAAQGFSLTALRPRAKGEDQSEIDNEADKVETATA